MHPDTAGEKIAKAMFPLLAVIMALHTPQQHKDAAWVFRQNIH